MVVGWSDFAIGFAPATEEGREPDGVAAGQCATHPQQTKHFQRGSATVLCTTVNFRAVFIAQHFCGAAAQMAAKEGAKMARRALILAARQGAETVGSRCLFEVNMRVAQFWCAAVDMRQRR